MEPSTRYLAARAKREVDLRCAEVSGEEPKRARGRREREGDRDEQELSIASAPRVAGLNWQATMSSYACSLRDARSSAAPLERPPRARRELGATGAVAPPALDKREALSRSTPRELAAPPRPSTP